MESSSSDFSNFRMFEKVKKIKKRKGVYLWEDLVELAYCDVPRDPSILASHKRKW